MSLAGLAALQLPASADTRIFGPGLAWWFKTTERLGRLPTRQDMEPGDLGARALPHVMLIDIDPECVRLRWRLMGTAHVEFNKRDLTGTYLADVYPPTSPILAYVQELYRELIARKRPIWSVNDIPQRDDQFKLRLRRLMLPFSSNCDTVDLCVAIQIVEYPPIKGADFPNPWRNSAYVGEQERLFF